SLVVRAFDAGTVKYLELTQAEEEQAQMPSQQAQMPSQAQMLAQRQAQMPLQQVQMSSQAQMLAQRQAQMYSQQVQMPSQAQMPAQRQAQSSLAPVQPQLQTQPQGFQQPIQTQSQPRQARTQNQAVPAPNLWQRNLLITILNNWYNDIDCWEEDEMNTQRVEVMESRYPAEYEKACRWLDHFGEEYEGVSTWDLRWIPALHLARELQARARQAGT
ncbi:hypothetical protein LTR22_027353, partial [Elasticomyces elasticus]